ncbi:MAG: hypothetical protein GF364_01530 [Candidatus Lokiarchaeota archaeon]|nr:hypothetical protein [Candidatus Lokiarchaeota archaeon]
MVDLSLSENAKNWISDLEEGDTQAKKKALFNLGEMNVKAAVPQIIDLLKNDDDKVVRNNAARALGKIKDKSALNALCEALHDEDYYVRQNAAWALGKLKDKRAIEPLLRLIKGGGAKVYKSSGAQRDVDQEQVTDTLKEEGMKYHDVQIKAIKALGDLGDEKAVGALIAEYDDDEAQIRCAISLALGKIKSKKATSALIRALSDPLWYVRRDAAIALGKIKDARAIDALINKLNDKYLDVAEKAARALSNIGKVAVAKSFLLKPKNEHVKKLIKNNFKGKKELFENLMKAADLEKDEQKRAQLKDKIKQILG